MNTPLEDRIKAKLELSSTQLDTETLQRLQAARRLALRPNSKANWLSFKSWVPAAGLAFCTVIAILIAFPNHQTINNNQPDQTAMLELLNEPEDLDTLSDPDFYIWMEEIEASKKDNYAA
jgi:hypothetical protein